MQVCIVKKQSSDRLYAMKYMNKAQCEAKEAIGNVFREIEILASLEHPFLVNLWFSFQDEEDMFMVVDLLLGGDLRYHLQEGTPFTDEAMRLFILEVASALDYLRKKSIIHRDIKPDNLLLDSEGHVHLTDFNIATVLREGYLVTSMSGTKPYMAPEVFECALDRCDGYSFPVDWWSLGITAYEVRRGKRPFDIHSNTPLADVRLMLLSPTRFPSEWAFGLVHIITKLLTVSPASRTTSLESLQRIPFAAEVSAEQILRKEVKPPFTPPKDHLNCDPTFELEEMIIESKPLHKKKKRLSKQKSSKESQSSPLRNHSGDPPFYDRMLIFNREREEIRKEREKKEREWQEELDRSMNLSDPTGHGSNFSGSKLSTKRKKTTKDSPAGKDDALEGVLSTLIAASACSFAASIGPLEGLQSLEKSGLYSPLVEGQSSSEAKDPARKHRQRKQQMAIAPKAVMPSIEANNNGRIPDDDQTSPPTKSDSEASNDVGCPLPVQANTKMERIKATEESSRQKKQENRTNMTGFQTAPEGAKQVREKEKSFNTSGTGEKPLLIRNSNSVDGNGCEVKSNKPRGPPELSQASVESDFKRKLRHCQSENFETRSSHEKMRSKKEGKEFNQLISFDSYMKDGREATSLPPFTVCPHLNAPSVSASQIPPKPFSAEAVSVLSSGSMTTLSSAPSTHPAVTTTPSSVCSSLSLPLSFTFQLEPRDSSSTTLCGSTCTTTAEKPTLHGPLDQQSELADPRHETSALRLRRATRPKAQRSSSLNLQTSQQNDECLPKRSSGGGRLEGEVKKIPGDKMKGTSHTAGSATKREDGPQVGAKHDTEIFIATCSLNPLYTSNLEYIRGPSSFRRTQTEVLNQVSAVSNERISEGGPSAAKDPLSPDDKRVLSEPHQCKMSPDSTCGEDTTKGSRSLVRAENAKTVTSDCPDSGDPSGDAEVLGRKSATDAEKERKICVCPSTFHNLQTERPTYKLNKMLSSTSLSHFERSRSNPKIYKRSASSDSAKLKNITPSPLEGKI